MICFKIKVCFPNNNKRFLEVTECLFAISNENLIKG